MEELELAYMDSSKVLDRLCELFHRYRNSTFGFALEDRVSLKSEAYAAIGELFKRDLTVGKQRLFRILVEECDRYMTQTKGHKAIARYMIQ
jgi:hypothetical protein